MYWVDINFAHKKGLKFYQTRSNATILHETLPAYSIPKVVRMETVEIIYEKVYASPRLPPKISLKHDCMKELGAEVALQKQKAPNQPNQTQIQIMIERGPRQMEENRPVPRRSKHVLFMKKLFKHDRTVTPVVGRDATHEPGKRAIKAERGGH